MELNKIVVRFKDGRILKGTTSNFFNHKQTFHLNRVGGQVDEIDIEKLKSVFFVKDHNGDNNYIYKYDDDIPGGGKQIAVEFQDGEAIIGYVLAYSPQRRGFMMSPADLAGNNERVFVIKSATKSVEFITNGHSLPKPAKQPRLEDRDTISEWENRKYPRVMSDNLLSYVCFDEDQTPLEQGMGKNLNVGLGGLLMETKVPLGGQDVLLMAINIKEELIKIKGKVIFCKESGPNIFNTGIRFIETNERIREIVGDMLRFYVETKAK